MRNESHASLVRDTCGAGLTEYVVLLGLGAVAVLGAARLAGDVAKRRALAQARCITTYECEERYAEGTDPPAAASGAPTATAAGAASTTPPDTTPRGPRSLAENRDRLLAGFAKDKGWSTCEQWAAMNESERYVFLTQTKVLGSYASFIYPPTRHRETLAGESCDGSCQLDGSYNCPWGYTTFNGDWVTAETCEECGACTARVTQDNTETLLDHATTVYSVNGADPAGGCGGGEYNRMYVGFDDIGEGAIRNHTISGGTWAKSNDCAGPHKPFTASETVSWGKGAAPPWCGSFFTGGQKYGPQRHHWKWDHEAKPLNRLGLCDVRDASVTEFDIDYDWKHGSNPLCSYGGRKGYEEVEKRLGPAEYDYVPSGCDRTPPNPGWGGGLGCHR